MIIDALYGVDMPGLETPLNQKRTREAAEEDEALEDSPRTRTVNIPQRVSFRDVVWANPPCTMIGGGTQFQRSGSLVRRHS